MNQLIKKVVVILIALVICCLARNREFEEPVISILASHIYEHDVALYENIDFLFYNVLRYDGHEYEPPYPYLDGRVRSGRYKASETAMEEYISSLSDFSGMKFRLVSLVNEDSNMPGLVMACENGDTLLFNANIVQGQFVSENYLMELQKDVGTNLFYIFPHSLNDLVYDIIAEKKDKANRDIYEYFYGFKEEETGDIDLYVPFLSEWRVVEVSFDTAFVGRPGVKRNAINSEFDRVKYVLENPVIGKLSVHMNLLNQLTHREFLADSLKEVKECQKKAKEHEKSGNSFSFDSIGKSDAQGRLERCLQQIHSTTLNAFSGSMETVFSQGEYGRVLMIAPDVPNTKDDILSLKVWAQKGMADAVFFESYMNKNVEGMISAAKMGSLMGLYHYSYSDDLKKESENNSKEIAQNMLDGGFQKYGESKHYRGMFEKNVLAIKNAQNLKDLQKLAKENGNVSACDFITNVLKNREGEKSRESAETKLVTAIHTLESKIASGVKKSDLEKLFKQYVELYKQSSDFEVTYGNTSEWLRMIRIGDRKYRIYDHCVAYKDESKKCKLSDDTFAAIIEQYISSEKEKNDDEDIISKKRIDAYKMADKYGCSRLNRELEVIERANAQKQAKVESRKESTGKLKDEVEKIKRNLKSMPTSKLIELKKRYEVSLDKMVGDMKDYKPIFKDLIAVIDKELKSRKD